MRREGAASLLLICVSIGDGLPPARVGWNPIRSSGGDFDVALSSARSVVDSGCESRHRVMPMKKTAGVPAKKKAVASRKKPAAKSLSKTTSKGSVPKSKSAKTAPPTKKAAARVKRPPLPRRVIFIDVENTSSEERLTGALEVLKIDRRAQHTDLIAVGNWKAVGARTGRLLARSGATLMHSAPATGVRDWSDLWIAVAAGRWIAQAEPGDRLDIVSDDHAFDAVADAAAGAGVEFHRVSYRTMGAVHEEVPREVRPKRRRRGGRRRGGGRGVVDALEPSKDESLPEAPVVQEVAARIAAPDVVETVNGASAGSTASPEDIREAIRSLTGGHPERWVNLDLVGNALRAKGFTRPPGSPRLVTRARQVEDVEVSPTGMARIRPGAAGPATEPVARTAPAESPAKPPRPRRPPPRRRTSPSAARAISEG